MVEIRKLNAIIRKAENELLLIRKQFQAAVDDCKNIGMQIIHRNEELSLLYQKSNIQENILRNGDIELKRREEVINLPNFR